MEIKDKSNKIIYSAEVSSIRELVERAVGEKVSLENAYLAGANLEDTILEEDDELREVKRLNDLLNI